MSESERLIHLCEVGLSMRGQAGRISNSKRLCGGLTAYVKFSIFRLLIEDAPSLRFIGEVWYNSKSFLNLRFSY